ncbi:hypothetical protein GmHk_01G001143 [Glycine max]|nr:hypothetical protein GmHk_01G001143 [Glycine max]
MGDQTMKGLSLYDDVDTEINFQLTKEAVDFSLCLVGRFLTNKNIRVPIMKEQLANPAAIFLFDFYHNRDYLWVLNGGSWNFDKHLLILGTVKEGEDPALVPLFFVPFWIQIHNLPIGFMSAQVGESLGNFIGMMKKQRLFHSDSPRELKNQKEMQERLNSSMKDLRLIIIFLVYLDTLMIFSLRC